MANGNPGSKPAYPLTFEPLKVTEPWTSINEKLTGQAVNFKFGVTDENFVQPSAQWDVLGSTADQQEHLIYNVASRLKDAEAVVRERRMGCSRK